MNQNPRVDADRAAAEVKAFLDGKKMDLIDWNYTEIQAYPDPKDDAMPELKRFAAEWDDFFRYADSVVDEAGGGFPNDVAIKYEAETKRIEDAVNGDAAFWARIRAEVMPLYRKPTATGDSRFDDRWNGVKIFYDPIGMEVVTTQMMTNKRTGERHRGEVISKRVMPAGFVVQVL